MCSPVASRGEASATRVKEACRWTCGSPTPEAADPARPTGASLPAVHGALDLRATPSTRTRYARWDVAVARHPLRHRHELPAGRAVSDRSVSGSPRGRSATRHPDARRSRRSDRPPGRRRRRRRVQHRSSIDDAIATIERAATGAPAGRSAGCCTLGGDHTIALPAAARRRTSGARPHRTECISTRTSTPGTRTSDAAYTHGTPFRRAFEGACSPPRRAMCPRRHPRARLREGRPRAGRHGFGFEIVSPRCGRGRRRASMPPIERARRKKSGGLPRLRLDRHRRPGPRPTRRAPERPSRAA